jgi:hypothetical protein
MHKTMLCSLPKGMGKAVSISNGEGITIESSSETSETKTFTRIFCGPLKALPLSPIINAELWLAALECSLPPQGEKLYTWKDYGNYILEMIKPSLRSSAVVDSIAATLPSDSTEVIPAAFLYVNKNLRYYGSFEGIHSYVPRPFDEVLKKGYGDCKELAAVLYGLLRAKGIAASLVLISARPLFLQMNESVPNLSGFNHMIVAVSRKNGFHYLDPTVVSSDADHSYYPTLNRKTLVLCDDGAVIDSVVPREGYKNEIRTVSSIVSKENNTWTLAGAIHYYGCAAFYLEYELQRHTTHTENEILSSELRQRFGLTSVAFSLVSHSVDSICITFSCPFTEYAVALPLPGFILQVPQLHRSYTPEIKDVVEGPLAIPRYSQTDSWRMPEKMMKSTFIPLTGPIAQGSWRIVEDSIVVRQFTSNRTLFQSVRGDECTTFIKERDCFEKGTIWKE